MDDYFLEGTYGPDEFFSHMNPNDWAEYWNAPQHADPAAMRAMQLKQEQDDELMRQVKKYGKEELNPMLSTTEMGLPTEDTMARTFQLKAKGERKKPDKKKEPTHRLRKKLGIYTNTSTAPEQPSNDGKNPKKINT
tara:strand:+ start:95 stop:502 length:408 start_codon:yes stop_codon:yes gene_type:complete